MEQSSCSWSPNLISWTISFSLIIIVCIASFIIKHSMETNYLIGAALILLVGFIPPVFCSPRKIQVTSDTIKVKMVVFSYSIPLGEVEKIEPHLPSNGTRLFGIGNFFGCVGWFKNLKLGKYLAFVTNNSRCYVIYRKNDIPVVVTADDGVIFQQFMNK